MREFELYIITGVSGAGRTLATNVFEDQGFYCVDNLPPELLETFVELISSGRQEVRRIAIVCDSRGGSDFQVLLDALARLEEKGISRRMVFLEAATDVLIRRFSETRRRHPVAGSTIRQSIEKERELLVEVRKNADVHIDTSHLSGVDLKKRLLEVLGTEALKGRLRVVVSSFGFKYGLPSEADLVFDARFLPNPYYIEELSHLSGLERAVQEFVMDQDGASEFLRRVLDLLRFLVPHYAAEGKSQLTVAVGCTGGRHRSVTIAERLVASLREDVKDLVLHHRDIDRVG